MKQFNEELLLKQLYDLRKEDYEEYMHNKSDELKKINSLILESEDKIISFIREKAGIDKLDEFIPLFNNYQIKSYDEINFWTWQYYKLGVCDYKKFK